MNKEAKKLLNKAIKLNACKEGIEYAKQFNTLKEFLNSENKKYVTWFLRNIKENDNMYFLIENKNDAIKWASENGHHKVVKILLQDKRVDPSADDNCAIKWASDNGHHKVVKLLLQDKRVDPSAGDNYAIRFASENGHHEVVKLLLQHSKVDPSAEDNYAIRYASEYGHHEVVKLLKNHKGVI